MVRTATPPETTLCQRWALATCPATLATTAGETVELHSPGQWRRLAGPDFEHAQIRIAGHAVEGPIEIHRNASDWYRHRHHLDHRYDDVVLHVVLHDDLAAAVMTRRGRRVPTLVVPPLERPESVLPDRPVYCRPDDPCQLKPIGLNALSSILRDLGQARLEAKTQRFRNAIAELGPDQALYTSTLEALGYRQNQRPFRELAARLPWRQLTGSGTYLETAALLFGVAGLLGGSERREATSLVGTALEAEMSLIWQRRSSVAPPLDPNAWEFAVRPANSPRRRLLAAAWLITYVFQPSPASAIRSLLSQVDRPSMLTRRLVYRLHDPADPPAMRDDDGGWRSGIGLARAREIVANVVLPFALADARARGDVRAAAKSVTLWRELPMLMTNEVTRGMSWQLARIPDRLLARSVVEHQGLIHLCREFCLARRCDVCPVAHRAPSQSLGSHC